MLGLAQHVNDLDAKPNRNDAKQHAGANIRRRNPWLATPQQRKCFQSEGRESREPTQQASKQKEARVRTEQLVLLDQACQYARDQAAHNIDGECAERKFFLHGQMQHPAAQLVPSHRANEPSKTYPQNVCHRLAVYQLPREAIKAVLLAPWESHGRPR